MNAISFSLFFDTPYSEASSRYFGRDCKVNSSILFEGITVLDEKRLAQTWDVDGHSRDGGCVVRSAPPVRSGQDSRNVLHSVRGSGDWLVASYARVLGDGLLQRGSRRKDTCRPRVLRCGGEPYSSTQLRLSSDCDCGSRDCTGCGSRGRFGSAVVQSSRPVHRKLRLVSREFVSARRAPELLSRRSNSWLLRGSSCVRRKLGNHIRFAPYHWSRQSSHQREPSGVLDGGCSEHCSVGVPIRDCSRTLCGSGPGVDLRVQLLVHRADDELADGFVRVLASPHSSQWSRGRCSDAELRAVCDSVSFLEGEA